MSITTRRLTRKAQRHWLSGMGTDLTDDVKNGAISAWRGNNPIRYARAWADADVANFTNLYMLGSYTNWTDGVVDVSCGGFIKGETWDMAANGDFDTRWQQQAASFKARGGTLRQVHMSPFSELNGTWQPWSVTGTNIAAFKTGFARWVAIMRGQLPSDVYKIVFSLNYDNNCNVPIESYLPPLDQFDILGVDIYSAGPDIKDQTTWDNWYNSWQTGSPLGLGAWATYALSIDKPISFPEWGVNPFAISDNPFWIARIHDAFRSIAPLDPYNPRSGELAGDAYYNNGANTMIYPSGAKVPLTSAAYKSIFAVT